MRLVSGERGQIAARGCTEDGRTAPIRPHSRVSKRSAPPVSKPPRPAVPSVRVGRIDRAARSAWSPLAGGEVLALGPRGTGEGPGRGLNHVLACSRPREAAQSVQTRRTFYRGSGFVFLPPEPREEGHAPPAIMPSGEQCRLSHSRIRTTTSNVAERLGKELSCTLVARGEGGSYRRKIARP